MKPKFHPVTSCESKHRFTSKATADRAAKVSRERGLAAYHCRYCSGWHVGHAIKLPGRPPRPIPTIEYEELR